MAKQNPLERALFDILSVLKVIGARQTAIERAVLLLGAGQPLPADLIEQLNQTVTNAEAARDMALRGVAPSQAPASSGRH